MKRLLSLLLALTMVLGVPGLSAFAAEIPDLSATLEQALNEPQGDDLLTQAQNPTPPEAPASPTSQAPNAGISQALSGDIGAMGVGDPLFIALTDDSAPTAAEIEDLFDERFEYTGPFTYIPTANTTYIYGWEDTDPTNYGMATVDTTRAAPSAVYDWKTDELDLTNEMIEYDEYAINYTPYTTNDTTFWSSVVMGQSLPTTPSVTTALIDDEMVVEPDVDIWLINRANTSEAYNASGNGTQWRKISVDVSVPVPDYTPNLTTDQFSLTDYNAATDGPLYYKVYDTGTDIATTQLYGDQSSATLYTGDITLDPTGDEMLVYLWHTNVPGITAQSTGSSIASGFLKIKVDTSGLVTQPAKDMYQFNQVASDRVNLAIRAVLDAQSKGTYLPPATHKNFVVVTDSVADLENKSAVAGVGLEFLPDDTSSAYTKYIVVVGYDAGDDTTPQITSLDPLTQFNITGGLEAAVETYPADYGLVYNRGGHDLTGVLANYTTADVYTIGQVNQTALNLTSSYKPSTDKFKYTNVDLSPRLLYAISTDDDLSGSGLDALQATGMTYTGEFTVPTTQKWMSIYAWLPEDPSSVHITTVNTQDQITATVNWNWRTDKITLTNQPAGMYYALTKTMPANQTQMNALLASRKLYSAPIDAGVTALGITPAAPTLYLLIWPNNDPLDNVVYTPYSLNTTIPTPTGVNPTADQDDWEMTLTKASTVEKLYYAFKAPGSSATDAAVQATAVQYTAPFDMDTIPNANATLRAYNVNQAGRYSAFADTTLNIEPQTPIDFTLQYAAASEEYSLKTTYGDALNPYADSYTKKIDAGAEGSVATYSTPLPLNTGETTEVKAFYYNPTGAVRKLETTFDITLPAGGDYNGLPPGEPADGELAVVDKDEDELIVDGDEDYEYEIIIRDPDTGDVIDNLIVDGPFENEVIDLPDNGEYEVDIVLRDPDTGDVVYVEKDTPVGEDWTEIMYDLTPTVSDYKLDITGAADSPYALNFTKKIDDGSPSAIAVYLAQQTLLRGKKYDYNAFYTANAGLTKFASKKYFINLAESDGDFDQWDKIQVVTDGDSIWVTGPTYDYVYEIVVVDVDTGEVIATLEQTGPFIDEHVKVEFDGGERKHGTYQVEAIVKETVGQEDNFYSDELLPPVTISPAAVTPDSDVSYSWAEEKATLADAVGTFYAITDKATPTPAEIKTMHTSSTAYSSAFSVSPTANMMYVYVWPTKDEGDLNQYQKLPFSTVPDSPEADPTLVAGGKVDVYNDGKVYSPMPNVYYTISDSETMPDNASAMLYSGSDVNTVGDGDYNWVTLWYSNNPLFKNTGTAYKVAVNVPVPNVAIRYDSGDITLTDKDNTGLPLYYWINDGSVPGDDPTAMQAKAVKYDGPFSEPQVMGMIMAAARAAGKEVVLWHSNLAIFSDRLARVSYYADAVVPDEAIDFTITPTNSTYSLKLSGNAEAPYSMMYTLQTDDGDVSTPKNYTSFITLQRSHIYNLHAFYSEDSGENTINDMDLTIKTFADGSFIAVPDAQDLKIVTRGKYIYMSGASADHNYDVTVFNPDTKATYTTKTFEGPFVEEEVMLPSDATKYQIEYTISTKASDNMVALMKGTPVAVDSTYMPEPYNLKWNGTSMIATADISRPANTIEFELFNTDSNKSYQINTTGEFTNVPSGKYELRAVAYNDENETLRSKTTMIRVTVDSDKPELTLIPINMPGTIPGVIITATDLGSGINRIEVTINGKPQPNVASGTTVYAIAEGSNVFKVIAYDNMGNEAAGSATVDYDKDLLNPTITVPNDTPDEDGTPREWWNAALAVTVSASNQSTKLQYLSLSQDGKVLNMLNASPPEESLTFNYDLTDDGVYELSAQAMSPGGLPSGGTTTKTVKIDSKKPDKPEIFVSEEGMLTIEAKDATSGIDEIRYQITGKPESEYTGEVKLTGNGEVTIAAIATDNAGNVSEAATFKAEIYTEKPAAPELVGVSNDWVVSEEPVIVTIVQGTGSNKPAASSTTTTTGTNEISIRYQVNGDSSAEGGWQLYKEGAEIPFDEEGTYRISAFTEDEHGNKSEVVTGNVKIDYTAPSMRGIATSRFDSSIDRTSFRLYFEDDVSGVDKIFVGIDGQEKRLDITAKHRSQGYATMTLQMPPVNSDQVVASTDTGSLDEEVVVPGAHVVFFRALDKAGNESKIEMISDYPGNPATASQDTIDKTNPFTGK